MTFSFRGSGTANTIALVEEEENSFVVPSKYAAFLNSSVLITGAVLVSTQRCLVEGMKIGINASINVPEAGIFISHYNIDGLQGACPLT